MGRTGTTLAVLGAAMLLHLGCKHDEALKPQKQDPVYNLPPNDPRYSSYPKYPENTLNQFPNRSAPGADDLGGGQTPGKFGMGGMGGPGQH